MCRKNFENQFTNKRLTSKNVFELGFCLGKGDNPKIFYFEFWQVCRLYLNVWTPGELFLLFGVGFAAHFRTKGILNNDKIIFKWECVVAWWYMKNLLLKDVAYGVVNIIFAWQPPSSSDYEIKALFQVLNLALREPPKDAIQPTFEERIETEEQSIEIAEAEIEQDTESEKEPENKSKDKVTLKELASQNKVEKASREDISETAENKTEGTENEPALKDTGEVEDETSQIEKAPEIDKLPSEVKEPVSESADKENQSDLKEADDTQPINEAITVTAEEKQPMGDVVTDDVIEVEQREVTEDEVKANLEKKEAMMLQEDTTDSEVLYINSGLSLIAILSKMQIFVTDRNPSIFHH